VSAIAAAHAKVSTSMNSSILVAVADIPTTLPRGARPSKASSGEGALLSFWSNLVAVRAARREL
jgi:hypothetical protein